MTTSTLTAAPALHDLLAERRSTRGFSPDRQVADTTLHTLLEAARWAPSANNSQPWRFGVAPARGARLRRAHRSPRAGGTPAGDALPLSA